MRKLASIQRVLALDPIPNADRIECAQINGWRVVVKKGEFQVDGLAVFLEIDAVPPDDSRFDWLWQKEGQPHIARPDNFRLKTKKLRGVVSQGVLIPLKEFAGAVLDDGSVVMKAGIDPEALDIIHAQEGDDVTAVLGVDKYEPPPPKSGRGSHNVMKRVSDFPTYLVPKTDEERVQSCTKVLFELTGKPWLATMKCDGQSATYVYDPEKDDVLFCSRNFVISKDPIVKPEKSESAWLLEVVDSPPTWVRAGIGWTTDPQAAERYATKEDADTMLSLHPDFKGLVATEHVFFTPEKVYTNCWVEVGKKYGLHEKLKEPQFRDLAIQGEMVGPSSQGNPLGLKEDDIRVFSIFNTKTRQYLTYKEMQKVCDQLALPTVPVLYEGDSFYPELLDAPPTQQVVGHDEEGKPLFEKRPRPEGCETCAGCPDCLTYEQDRSILVARKMACDTVIGDLLKKAEGKYPDTKNEREGLVIRPRDEEMWSNALQGRLSFKCINNKFLLNEKD